MENIALESRTLNLPGLQPRLMAQETPVIMYERTHRKLKMLVSYLNTNHGSTDGTYCVEDVLQSAIDLLAQNVPGFGEFEASPEAASSVGKRVRRGAETKPSKGRRGGESK